MCIVKDKDSTPQGVASGSLYSRKLLNMLHDEIAPLLFLLLLILTLCPRDSRTTTNKRVTPFLDTYGQDLDFTVFPIDLLKYTETVTRTEAKFQRGNFPEYVVNLYKICTILYMRFEWDAEKDRPKLWTAVFTTRGDSTRIISVRRARRKEAKLYEKETTGEKHRGI